MISSHLDSMALKVGPICGNGKKNSPYSQRGVPFFAGSRPDFLNLRIGRGLKCLCQRAVAPAQDESPSAHKDLNSLPKPLTATYFPSSSSDGTKVRVAYQGVPGAYSEAAALKAYPKCETVPCDHFEDAFKAVELWLADKAVLPIENSVGGSIHRNYDLLLRHRLHIAGEVQLIVNHCLLGLPGVRKEELKRVLSHPQALDQCEIFLNELGVTRVSADDPAHAAQIVACEGVREAGAVASARAADIYGLDVLAERIQDDSDNVTRFLILAREPIIPGTDRPYKTSIVFSLEEGPGILFKALAVFALRGINLSKIESRPQRRRPLRVVDDSNRGSATHFDYLFYIDFEASMAEPRAQFALGHLQVIENFHRTKCTSRLVTIISSWSLRGSFESSVAIRWIYLHNQVCPCLTQLNFSTWMEGIVAVTVPQRLYICRHFIPFFNSFALCHLQSQQTEICHFSQVSQILG